MINPPIPFIEFKNVSREKMEKATYYRWKTERLSIDQIWDTPTEELISAWEENRLPVKLNPWVNPDSYKDKGIV